MERYVRGDISRKTNGPNIRAMVSLGILISLGTFLVWQTVVEVNEEKM